LFLYVIEPGGNRIELFGDSGYLIFDPAWKPVRWQASQAAKGIIWIGSDLPKEFFLYGTPIVGSEPAKDQPPQSAEQREGVVVESIA
jgi:catechol 2,3-dioxygenase